MTFQLPTPKQRMKDLILTEKLRLGILSAALFGLVALVPTMAIFVLRRLEYIWNEYKAWRSSLREPPMYSQHPDRAGYNIYKDGKVVGFISYQDYARKLGF